MNFTEITKTLVGYWRSENNFFLSFGCFSGNCSFRMRFISLSWHSQIRRDDFALLLYVEIARSRGKQHKHQIKGKVGKGSWLSRMTQKCLSNVRERRSVEEQFITEKYWYINIVNLMCIYKFYTERIFFLEFTLKIWQSWGQHHISKNFLM